MKDQVIVVVREVVFVEAGHSGLSAKLRQLAELIAQDKAQACVALGIATARV